MKLAGLVLSLTLALFAFQAAGGFELLLDAECRQGCLDDDERGRCSDACADCTCCFHARPMARAAVTLAAAPAVRACAPERTVPSCATAPPHEILHVPIG